MNNLSIFPNTFVVKIPIDSFIKSIIEVPIQLPSETANLVAVDRVPEIVAQPITDMLNKIQRFIQATQNPSCYFQVGEFVTASYVIDLSRLTLLQNQINCLTIVRHIQPITYVIP